MSCSPCWGPCERTLWKDHSPHTHRQGAAPRCPLTPARPFHPPTLAAPGRGLFPVGPPRRSLCPLHPPHPGQPSHPPAPSLPRQSLILATRPFSFLHPPTLAAPGRGLFPRLSVDLMSGHGALRLGVHVLFGVWKDQLIWFCQVLDVTEGGQIGQILEPKRL